MTYEKFVPREGYVVVEEEALSDKTKGGVFIPDTAEGPPTRYGKVLKGGNIEGSIVVYPEYAGMKLAFDDRDDLKLLSLMDLYGGTVLITTKKE